MLAQPTLLFGHPAYHLGDAYRRKGGQATFREERSLQGMEREIGNADVLVVSRFWRNDWIERAGRLKFIQSVSAGTEQFDCDRLRGRGIRLASARGVNANAVAEHIFGLILSLSRRLHHARDHQRARHWRGIVSDLATREFELSGATMVIVGLGQIGDRVATLAKAFGMRVIGIRRSPASPDSSGDEVRRREDLAATLGEADVVVLACPLTPETEGMIDAAAFAAMKRTALLINVARGRVVNEADLIHALQAGMIAGAGLDCFYEEPMPATNALWDFENVLITSHNAGDTRRYEDGVIDILLPNLAKLARGETDLINQVV